MGLLHYQKGEHAAALPLIKRAASLNPCVPDVHYNCGLVLRALGRSVEALACYDRALDLNPDFLDAHNSRGNTLRRLGRPDEALVSYDRALQLNPDYVAAHYNRANVLADLDRPEEALDGYDRALELNRDHPEALHNRGNALLTLKRLDEALASYQRALQLKPDDVLLLCSLATALLESKRAGEALKYCDRALQLRPDCPDALLKRGSALRKLSRLAEALETYDRLLQLKSDCSEAHFGRGNVLADLKRPDEAIESFDRALRLNSRYVEALCNRGAAFVELGRPHEAVASFDAALQIRPDDVRALNNRGNALRDLNRLDEALADYESALRRQPKFTPAAVNRATLRLLQGQFRDGWIGYGRQHRIIHAPPWNGEDIAGARIAVYSEGGAGDAIQFARYLPLLVGRGARVTFVVPANLVRLLRSLSSRVDVVSSIEKGRPFDFQCAIMSLPAWFRTDSTSIPNEVPYLCGEEHLVARWREKIGERGFRIGIAWQGSPGGDRGRSIPLAEFARISEIPDVRLISLQKNDRLEQIATLPEGAKVEAFGDQLDNGPDSFIDTAAIMCTLDLIITSDTSIAHLGGALARPTWIALKLVPEWRWLLDRSDSPWYRTVRLFRQETVGDWKPVFTKIEQALRTRLSLI